MTILREAAQQALEALESSRVFVTSREKIKHPEGTEWYDERIAALRAALAQEQAEPVREMPSNTRYTVAVEGQALTYWDNIHDAITNAQRAVYAGPDATTRAIDDLSAGRLAEWSYGFSAVRIYPPQKPVALAEPQIDPVDEYRKGFIAGQIDMRDRDGEQAEPTPGEYHGWVLREVLFDKGEPVGHREPVQGPVAHFGSAYVNENGVHITTVLGPVAIPQDAKLYTAPPQRKPLTEEKIDNICRQAHAGADPQEWARNFARAIERAHGIGETK